MDSRAKRRRTRWVAVGIIAAGVLALGAGTAAAGLLSSLHVTTRKVAGKSTKIVVDRRGDTIYELSGESLGHLKCITKKCLAIWPPVLARSASAKPPRGPGVPGPLTILRRVKAKLFQVMLGNHPIYYYSGDKKIGDANGQGIRSFGGTWHVVAGT